MKSRLIWCFVCATGLTGSALATPLTSGTLLSVDQTAGALHLGQLFTVNPNTGQRVVFSDFNNAAQGVLGVDPDAVGWKPPGLLGLIPGEVLVSDGSGGTNQQGALYAIDPSTGQRTLFSDFGNAAQGAFGANINALVWLPNIGGIGVSDSYAGTNGNGVVFVVNPSTGARTTLSDFGSTAQGPLGAEPTGLALTQ